MIKQKLANIKRLIQQITKQKTVKISKDGKIVIVLRFKSDELKVNDKNQLDKIQENIIKKISSVVNTKYKISTLQKEPAFCYNTYVRLLNISSQASQDKLKKNIKHFRFDESTKKFEKISYSEITITLTPVERKQFEFFLTMEQR